MRKKLSENLFMAIFLAIFYTTKEVARNLGGNFSGNISGNILHNDFSARLVKQCCVTMQEFTWVCANLRKFVQIYTSLCKSGRDSDILGKNNE